MYLLKLTRRLSISSRKFTSEFNFERKFKVGDKVSVVRKITDDDVLNFAKLTNDYNPIHVSAEKKLVHGALLNGFLSGVLGTKLPGPGTIVMTLRLVLLLFCVSAVRGREHENSASVVNNITPDYTDDNSTITTEAPLGCVCGIYLFEAKKLTKELPEGDPVISHNISEKFPNNPDGHKSALNRDCYKERAHLFIRNGSDKWIRTNLSAGREYCCKNNLPYKC
ncbi:Similar to Fcp3C: Follicle cell protein 3C-1 (Drosophila melanogaster) [Cotesia congregata]|uniref:Similar to Fcp3C: Follicle cell protein 3C-1 (Drosophila melanogaster) n=1 Tax=Cotesia congregata TaxID=51543 RepID=A0A8J2MMS7_COTCN|nr:Similar to Fcp3C: Follicle cell protein 3C-1 (Drosophila melanogaster) [Cotesia congregata]